jgi:hypothetical protein
MLLVTFHGGSGGIDNVYAYDTSTKQINSHKALQNVTLTKPELRGMVYANSLLYVVNGDKDGSNVMCFQPPKKSDSKYHFDYVGEFLGPSTDGSGKFKNGIGHPYAMVFSMTGAHNYCYVSNQDTNVVAQALVAGNFQSAAIQPGCASSYLKKLTSICPDGGCVYLDGTYVASQDGNLPDVSVQATNVPAANGGLSVSFADAASKPDDGKSGKDKSDKPGKMDKSKEKVQNSVRDLVISGGVLLVCDEPSKVLRLYSLVDGSYVGASAVMAASATHLAIFEGGLFISAGDQLYWSALSNSPTPQSLQFSSVLSAPAGDKVGGITFDSGSSKVYVAFQDGTGTTGTGSIYTYKPTFAAGSAPVFGAGKVFADKLADTPEFLLFLSL